MSIQPEVGNTWGVSDQEMSWIPRGVRNNDVRKPQTAFWITAYIMKTLLLLQIWYRLFQIQNTVQIRSEYWKETFGKNLINILLFGENLLCLVFPESLEEFLRNYVWKFNIGFWNTCLHWELTMISYINQISNTTKYLIYDNT